MEPLLREFSLLARAIVGWFWIFLVLASFLFLFGIRDTSLWGSNFPVPSLESRPLSVEIFRALERDLLPVGVQLISLDPFAGFVTQTLVSVLVSFLLTFPILLWRILSYLAPALHREEKRFLLLMLVPVLLLFFAGALFAYYAIIPPTFRFLYSFAPELDARPFLLVDNFLSTVTLLLVSVGLMFLMPALMVLLAVLRVVPSLFWREWWRHALLGFLIFAAIITPDGSGVTMIFLSFPMTLLYIGGFLAARYAERRGRLVGDKEGGTLEE